MAVTVLVPKISERLRWVIHHLCSPIIGLPFELRQSLEEDFSGPLIQYGTDPHMPHALCIPDDGLLWETGTHRPPATLVGSQVPSLDVSGCTEFADTDLFSDIFWLVSEYPTYQHPQTDLQGRYLEHETMSQLPLATVPVVHRWLEHLRQLLLSRWPSLQQELTLPAFPHRITVDLDNPWKYLHKPRLVQAGSFVKALLSGDRSAVTERIHAFQTGTDPYHTFDQWLAMCDPKQLTMMALIERIDKNDSRFTWRHKRWRQVLMDLQSSGVSIGIHPSYRSSEIPGQIQKETQRLHDIIRQPVTSARMHFFRYRLPQTRRDLIAAGIREDFTLYRNGEGGFPCGMMVPFPWYDLQAESITDLIIHPTLMMDRTFVGTEKPLYQRDLNQKLSRAESWLAQTLMTVDRGKGSFVVCLHNECLSESGEWTGWSSFFTRVIQTLANQSAL